MARLVALQYIGPHDAVEIADTGQIVARGAIARVPAEIAGREPSGAFADGVHADPGEGLLAQFTNFVPAPKTAEAVAEAAAPAEAAALAAEGSEA